MKLLIKSQTWLHAISVQLASHIARCSQENSGLLSGLPGDKFGNFGGCLASDQFVAFILPELLLEVKELGP